MAVEYRAIDWMEWLPGNLYRVGSDGSVWKWWRDLRWRQVKATRHNNRMVCTLCFGKVVRQFGISTLVLTAFVSPASPEVEPVHFPDHDRTNCRISNLRWGPKGTGRVGVRAGIAPQGRGVDCPASKLTEAQVIEARDLFRAGFAFSEIGEKFGVSASTVSSAVRGYSWAHIPGAVPLAEVRGNTGERIDRAILTRKKVVLARRLAREGVRPTDLARMMKVHVMTIYSALRGRTWKHVPNPLADSELDRFRRGSTRSSAKLTERDIVVIRIQAAEGVPLQRIANRFLVSKSNVSLIVKRKIWAHVA